MNFELKDIDAMIFVATLPRSGSSMDCGALECCGAFGGRTMGNVQANREGIFENRGLNTLLLNPILTEIDIHKASGLMTLQRAGGPPAKLFNNWVRDLTFGMNHQGYNGGTAYFKNGLYTFLFDRINEVMPDATWILPTRSDDAVYDSHRRLHPNKKIEVIRKEIADYREMYNHILNTAKSAYVIDNDKVIAGDLSSMENAIKGIGGLEWDEKAVREWINPDMWGGKSKERIKRGGNNYRP